MLLIHYFIQKVGNMATMLLELLQPIARPSAHTGGKIAVGLINLDDMSSKVSCSSM
jgi:hypothetical protein